MSFLWLAMGWDREDDVVVKQFFVTVDLILCQRGEGLTPQTSHYKKLFDNCIVLTVSRELPPEQNHPKKGRSHER